ncbi:hypothetical protein F0562_000945 [Nyssa sinensis]|uniref:Uncharacterized protein n=1 Tax=Nyssa sinensis TaxID=561372 RepID=A0A5J5C6L8_9ASTE|nr:hypothetical protein F0562_000945 [Nyssa sinensis]
MELLSPSHPPGPAGDRFSGFSSPANFRNGFDRTSRSVTSQFPEIVEEAGDRVHVAVVGKLPANQANSEVVSAYRREEREKTNRLLLNYLSTCCTSKVKASIITTEADRVQKGIIYLVNKYGIRLLVMGAVPENCMKVKKSSSKAELRGQKCSSIL